MLKKILLLMILLLSSTFPALAQTEVHATVNYAAVNLRDAPTALRSSRWNGTSNILAVLSQGERVVVVAVETVETYGGWGDFDDNLTWVYVHVPGRDLSGWLVSQYLIFDQADWMQQVQQLTSWDTLVEYASLRLSPAGLPGRVINSGGSGMYHIPIFSSPLDQTRATFIPIDVPITALGRALVDGEISPYIYIRTEDGQYGWLSYHNFGEVITPNVFKGSTYGTLDWFQVLPILFVNDAPPASLYLYGVVNNSHVNLRSEPHAGATILRELAYDTHLTLHSTTSYDQETAWLAVTVASTGETGWIAAQFVTLWASDWRGSRPSGRLENLPLSPP